MTEKLEQEALQTLDSLCEKQVRIPEVEWFLDEIHRHFSMRDALEQKPELIVLGAEFPWELAWSFGVTPYFVLGGSLETTPWSDALLPRDADPVSRSACGYLLNPQASLAEDGLIVTTLCSDHRRKLVELLREHGLSAAAADVPPVCTSEAAREVWAEELRTLSEAIEQHTGHRLRRSALRLAMRLRC